MQRATISRTASALAILLLASVAAGQEASPPAQTPPKKTLYDAKADAGLQLTAALNRAAKENRRVLIQWGAEWCGWCHLLSDCFKEQPKIAKTLRTSYVLVRVNVGRFDANMNLADKYGAKIKANGIPYLTILAADGKVLVNQETSSLEVGSKHDPAKVLAFLKKHVAPPRIAKDILNTALATAKKESKTVFLHFGAPWCGWCHRLEDWLAQKDVTRIMDERFVDVKIDTDLDKGGEAMRKHYAKGRSTGIPWFVVLAPDGTVLTTSDGPGGNIGYPWTDEEIKTFGVILARSKSGVSAEAVTALETSLKAFRASLESRK
jgi:thiol:disulfide interchange protein